MTSNIESSSNNTTTVEIEKFAVVKELCANQGISLRDFLNMLIKEYVRVNGTEYFNLRYFKDMSGKR